MSVEERELEPEATLRELFRPRRVDPDAFRAAVARRIAEREAAEHAARERETRKPARSAYVQRAAALLAFDPSGSGSSPLALLKLFGGALLLPLVVIGLQVAAFAHALGIVRHATSPDGRLEARRGSLRLGTWLLGASQAGGVLVLLAPFLLTSHWVVDLVGLLFVAASAGLALSVRGLAEEGKLTPRSVVRVTLALLNGLFAGFYLWRVAYRISEGSSDLGLGVSAAVLLAGMVLCPLVVRGGPRRAGTRASALGSLAMGIGFVLFLDPIGVTRSSPEALAAQLARLDTRLSPTDLRNWKEADELHEALVAVGGEVPRLERTAGELRSALEREIALHPTMLTTALRLGLLTSEAAGKVAEREREAHALDELLAGDGPLVGPSYEEYRMHLLLATRPLSAAQHAHLVARVEATWPSAGTWAALDRARHCMRLLELLGEDERLAARRAEVHALLRHHWVGDRASFFDKPGGFTSDPVKFPTSFADATADAVALMARHGVPSGIDLRLVRGYLRAESVAQPLLFEAMPELHATTRASLLRLEREVGIPPRGPAAALFAERNLLAVLLVVLLCLVTVRRTEEPPGARPGALP